MQKPFLPFNMMPKKMKGQPMMKCRSVIKILKIFINIYLYSMDLKALLYILWIIVWVEIYFFINKNILNHNDY